MQKPIQTITIKQKPYIEQENIHIAYVTKHEKLENTHKVQTSANDHQNIEKCPKLTSQF